MTYTPRRDTVFYRQQPTLYFQARINFEEPAKEEQPAAKEETRSRPKQEATPQQIAVNLQKLETMHKIWEVRQMYAKHLSGVGHSASYNGLEWQYKSQAETADLETVYSEMAKVYDRFKRH